MRITTTSLLPGRDYAALKPIVRRFLAFHGVNLAKDIYIYIVPAAWLQKEGWWHEYPKSHRIFLSADSTTFYLLHEVAHAIQNETTQFYSQIDANWKAKTFLEAAAW